MPQAAGGLTLVLPGLAPGASPVIAATPSPELRRLLTRADWAPDAHTTTTALLERFGLPPDTSLAALLARAELGEEATGWLRADPVHFRADAKLVMLIAPAVDEVAADEAEALLDELRTRLPEFRWRCGSDPRHWYVRMPNVDATPSLGPAWLHGRSLTPFFPQDPAHRRWRQAMTEVQMVMHDAAPNAAREARGALPLNALWIWGGGRAPSLAKSRLPALAIGRDPLLAGLAVLTGVAHVPEIDPVRIASAGGDIIVLAGAPYAAAGDATEVLADANACAGPVWRALMHGDVAGVTLVGEGLRGVLPRAARWRLWRRTMPGRFGDCHAVGPA